MSDKKALEFKTAFHQLEQSRKLSPELASLAFAQLLDGQWPEAVVGGFLVALELCGVDAALLTAAARAMRARMKPVAHDLPKVVDTCGTGGDQSGTLNISTGAALIVAATGVPVAKHGNRAASSRCGSADVLSELGIPWDVPVAAAQPLLDRHGIAFLFAQAHHPAVRFVMPARRQLGIRTLFNLLGPLCNPAGATHQLIGTFSNFARPLMAQALLELGSRAAWVVYGADGLDEVSPSGPTHVTELKRGALQERVVHPEDFGLEPIPREAIVGGSPADNAAVIRRVLAGEPHPSRNAFVLNAAACLAVSEDLPLLEATARATAALDSGKALALLQAWAHSAQSAASGGAQA